MADAFRGLTLRIGADARPLASALNSIKASASAAERQFRSMSKALKLDPRNVDAFRTRLEVAEDKMKLTANAADKIDRAVRQASASMVVFSQRSGLAGGKMENVSSSITDVYSTTQRVLSAYKHVDVELETIHNAVRGVVASENEWSTRSTELSAKMKKLKSSYGGTTAEARKLTAEMRKYIELANADGSIGKLFGDASMSGKKLIRIYEMLKKAHNAYQMDLEGLHRVEAFREAKTQLIAVRAEMRAASADAAKFATSLFKMGSSEALHKALAEVRALDGAIDSARASTRSMEEVFRAMPLSEEAAAAKVRAMRNEVGVVRQQLEKARDVLKRIEADPAFDKQARGIVNVHAALAKAENEVAEYKAKIKQAEQAVESLNAEIKESSRIGWGKADRSFGTVMADLKKARAALAEYKNEYVAVEARHRSASMATTYREAREEVIRLEAELAKLNPHLNKLQTLGERFRAIRTAGYGLYSTLTPAIMMMGRYALMAAENIDSSYRNMRKTVNGTEQDFEHLKSAALDFSRTHVTTAQQILEIESIGGQLGIAVENLEAFGTVVSNLDIATNIDAEDMATYIGQLSNIMRDIDTSNMDQYKQDITSFSDALVRLGNNSAAQESNIMKVMMRIASLGTISGFTTSQLLGISTAVAATGQGSEAAGTAIARTFSNIESAVGKGGEKLQAFASVSGMSAQEFADAWNGDPITAFTAFIRGLKEIDEAGGSVDMTLASLGINSVRQKQALENLTSTFDVMTQAIGMSGDAWNGMSTIINGSVERAGDAAREAQRKSEGFSGAMQMLRNNATAMAESLAQGAAPIISVISDLFRGLTGLVEAMPQPMKWQSAASSPQRVLRQSPSALSSRPTRHSPS